MQNTCINTLLFKTTRIVWKMHLQNSFFENSKKFKQSYIKSVAHDSCFPVGLLAF